MFLVHFVSLLEIKAQQSSIAGCVYENGNIPLSFASIIVKGQPIGAQTDEQGNYVVLGVKEGDILEIAFGMRTVKAEVLSVKEVVKKDDAALLYRIVE